jgi:hypothetical protein
MNLDQDSSWRPRLNLHLGRRLLFDHQHGLRLTMEALFGPSPQGQFRRGQVVLFALGIAVEI